MHFRICPESLPGGPEQPRSPRSHGASVGVSACPTGAGGRWATGEPTGSPETDRGHFPPTRLRRSVSAARAAGTSWSQVPGMVASTPTGSQCERAADAGAGASTRGRSPCPSTAGSRTTWPLDRSRRCRRRGSCSPPVSCWPRASRARTTVPVGAPRRTPRRWTPSVRPARSGSTPPRSLDRLPRELLGGRHQPGGRLGLPAQPTSRAPADVARRLAFRDRVDELNVVLAEVCAQYARCTTDGRAAFAAPPVLSELSPIDYWHPSIAAQAAIARLVWETLGY